MEISNGIRGLRFRSEQQSQQNTSAAQGPQGGRETQLPQRFNVNGNGTMNVRIVRSPKPLIARKIRSLFSKSQPDTISELFADERFLSKFFFLFCSGRTWDALPGV